MKVEVHIEQLDKELPLPQYAKVGDAGMDVCSTIDVLIDSFETKAIPIGFKVAIPTGYEIQVRPRSGMSLKTKFRVSNSPGTIDAGYRDELAVICDNIGNAPIYINRGDRIAQIVLKEVPIIEWNVTDDVGKIGVDRGGGFGHTGK